MERIEVILAAVQSGGQLCVVRRSTAVGSAAGLWSVVTGYLEPEIDPFQQALTELEEELSLRPPTVDLVHALPAIDLTSVFSNKLFRVHPFLFESVTREIVLNWEHDAVEWAHPERIHAADCVRWQGPIVRTLLERLGPPS